MIMSQRKPWNAWGALVCLCGMPSCVHAQTKNIAVWIDIEDPVLSPGESTLVTVWAKLDQAPGTQVQFGIPGAGVYPGTVLGFGHIAVWNIINDLGTAAGNFGLPAEQNPAFIIDQGKYGYFKYGCVLTLSSYNYSPGDIFFNPNATPDNPVWLYRATFTPNTVEYVSPDFHERDLWPFLFMVAFALLTLMQGRRFDPREAILLAGAAKARAIATPFTHKLRHAVGLRNLSAGAAPVKAAKASKAALPAFKQYREKDGQFYFKLAEASGQVMLQGTGFEAPKACGAAIARLSAEGSAALAELDQTLQPGVSAEAGCGHGRSARIQGLIHGG